jgi:hypothetical protein
MLGCLLRELQQATSVILGRNNAAFDVVLLRVLLKGPGCWDLRGHKGTVFTVLGVHGFKYSLTTHVQSRQRCAPCGSQGKMNSQRSHLDCTHPSLPNLLQLPMRSQNIDAAFNNYCIKPHVITHQVAPTASQ